MDLRKRERDYGLRQKDRREEYIKGGRDRLGGGRKRKRFDETGNKRDRKGGRERMNRRERDRKRAWNEERDRREGYIKEGIEGEIGRERER